MSVDDRIRQGLNANATAHQPAVESSLDRVRARGRQRRTTRMVVAAGLAVAAAATVLVVVRLDVGDRTLPPAPAPAPAPAPTSALFGRYESDVTVPARLAGRWVLELDGNGTVAVTPPAGYAGVVSGTLFTADATTLRINLFEQDVCAELGTGEFSWTTAGARLVLEATDEPCVPRRRFFTENLWQAAPK